MAPPKLLIVSASVYPKRSGSAIVMEKLVAQFGSEEVVLFGELAPFDRSIVRAPDLPRFDYFRSRFSFFGRGSRFFSPLRNKLRNRLVDRICRIAVREKCDRILGVYPDELYCHAACLAATKLGLPFFTYFHNTYAENAEINNEHAEKIQASLFEVSQCIFVMSEGMKRYYDGKYGEGKFVALPHTFEKYPATASPMEKKAGDAGVKIVAFGNFNESNIDATRRLADAVAGNSGFQLSLYTDVPPLLLARRGLNMQAVNFCGSLSHLAFSDMIDELRNHDIIALTHGFTGGYGSIEYQTIFPTRTIPMLLSQRPILLHSPPRAFLTTFMREHKAAFVIDTPSVQAVSSGIQSLYSDPRLTETLVGNAWQIARIFYGPEVAAVLRSIAFSTIQTETPQLS